MNPTKAARSNPSSSVEPKSKLARRTGDKEPESANPPDTVSYTGTLTTSNPYDLKEKKREEEVSIHSGERFDDEETNHELTDDSIDTMWSALENHDSSTIPKDMFMVFEYVGFNPIETVRSLAKMKERLKISDTDFKNDVAVLCSLAVIKGSINDNNIRKMSRAGQMSITDLEKKYNIKRSGGGSGISQDVVTIPRIAAAFPGLVLNLLKSGLVKSRRFDGPMNSNTLPEIMRHQAIAAAIPSTLKERVRKFLLDIVTAFLVDQSLVINQNKSKRRRADLEEVFYRQRNFVEKTAANTVLSDECRIKIFKALVINYEDLIPCIRAIRNVVTSFTVVAADEFERALSQV